MSRRVVLNECADEETMLSGSESEEARCCGWVELPTYMTNYMATKKVVIRSPWLAIPHLFFIVLVSLYIVGYQLMWQFRFMQRQEPDVSAVGRLQKPISHWDSCTDEDFDCFMHVAPILPPYCHEDSFGDPIVLNGRNVSQRTVQRCWRNDVHQKLSTSFLIPTMITFIAQSWAQGDGTQDWTNDNISEYYIENIEAFTVRLFHSFLADEVGVKGRAEQMQGYFTGENLGAPLQHIPCDQGCHYVDERVIDGIEPCGDSSATRNACFSSPWGDVFSVQTILGAAIGVPSSSPTGLHLDMPRPDKPGYTYRQAGAAIRIAFDYFNLKDVLLRFSRDWDFGKLLKPAPAYKLYFRPVRALTEATVSETDVQIAVDPISGMPDPTRRVLRRSTGIWVSLSHGGEIGAFSFRQLLLSFVTAMALFKIANLLVEHVLTWVYIRMGSAAHVSMLWQMHRSDTSMRCHELRSQLKRCDPEMVDRVVERGTVEDKDMVLLRRQHQHREQVLEKSLMANALE